MRAWILAACVLAGCLHVTAPATVPRDSARSAALDAWKEYLMDGNYEMAAMTARNAKLDPMLSGLALRLARKQARKHLRRIFNGEGSYFDRRTNLVEAYRIEVAIACTYSPSKTSGLLAVKDVGAAFERTREDDLLYPLLEYGCPLSHEHRFEIVMAAARDRKDDFALRQAIEANLNVTDKLEFIDSYLSPGKCSFGFKAAAALKPEMAYLVQLLRSSSCDSDRFDSRDWNFSQSELRGLFFDAVRFRKYHLAMEFSLRSGGGDDETRYLIEKMFEQHDEYDMEKLCSVRPELRSPIYAYALLHGRARFVGLQSRDIYWQEQAFWKLIGEGKFDDAAEVAEYGVSETLRTEGILTAFQMALAAEDMIDARYLSKRYPLIVPGKEYEKAEKAWIKAHPEDTRFGHSRKIPRRKKGKVCDSSSDEWAVRRCDE